MLNVELLPQSERFSISLTLPASRYDRLEACARLSVNDLADAHIRIPSNDEMPHLSSPLRIAVSKPTTFDELNFFAARLDSLSSQERFILDGLCYMHGPETMKELINMTYNLENVMVAGDIDTPRQLGEFLVENGFVEFPESVIPYLDFAKIGEQQLAENTCAIVDGVYFEDNRSPGEIKTVYDGVTLPEQAGDEYIFSVWIGNPGHNPDDSFFAELNLPDTDEETTGALELVGVSQPYEAIITNYESRIMDFALLAANENIDLSTLNSLADRIDRMDDKEYIKYKAVLEHESLIPVRAGLNADIGATLQKMDACSYRLEQYSFFPQYRDAESFGRYLLDAGNIPERVRPYVNLRGYGQSHLDELNISIGSYGMVRPEYEQKQAFAAEPEPEPEQTMGGM